MRIKMDNHYHSNSIRAEMENIDNDIDFTIKKVKKFSRQVYFKLRFSHNENNTTLDLNEEQLKKLAEHLETYVKSGAYQKRADTQTSLMKTVI